MLNRGVEQLLGRSIGPLQFRLFVMPTVVTLIAIRAGLRDARQGQPAFLWAIITDPTDRRRRLLAAWKDITRIFIVALVLDTLYQLMVHHAFYVGQTLIVAVTCAILPYVLFRGPTTRLVRVLSAKQTAAANSQASVDTNENTEEKPPRIDSGDRV